MREETGYMSMMQSEEARHEIPPGPRYLRREEPAARRNSGNGIGSLGALYVHALAIAQEATARYREFAAHAADHGNDAVAKLFNRLSELKAQQALRLAEVTPRTVSPKLALGEHAWLCSGPLLPEARDFIFRMMAPRQALEIAVRAEERAKAFVKQMSAAFNDAGVRELAIALGRDDDTHIAWLRDALALVPEPFRPGEDCPGDPAALQAL
jgi:hypothetical protein